MCQKERRNLEQCAVLTYGFIICGGVGRERGVSDWLDSVTRLGATITFATKAAKLRRDVAANAEASGLPVSISGALRVRGG